ncbi:MAG: response regulator [Terriglobia bacterium]
MARLILVADDSPTIQRRAQGILQGEGFVVETVPNGVAAIRKLPRLQPVLVLADVSMPGKDGYEVCDFVKTSKDLHHVPVLLVASDQEPYDEQRGAQVGADGIIKKPFSPHDLIAMVAKFAGLGEAPASLAEPAETLVVSSPVAPPEVSPMASEPDGATGGHDQDLAASSAGMAFEEPPEISAPPEPILEPWFEGATGPTLTAPESISETVVQPTPEPAPVAVEPTPEPIPEIATELVPVNPESISKTAVEPTPEPAPVAAEPTPEPIPEIATELVPVNPESISEIVVQPMPEPVPVAAEPTPEPIPEVAPELVPVGSESITETVVEPTSELPSAASEPPDAASGVPCAPVSVTETVHPPAEAAPEAPPAVPAEDLVLPIVEGQQPKPMAATCMDSSALAAAAESQVYVALPEAEAAPWPEAGAVQPGMAPEPPPPVINPEWVHVIVRKVVMKMAPPVLRPELVGELIRALTEEITAELNSESPPRY